MANRLINETSPYLRQHAHNPVDWYPWGEEALSRAVKEQKPILVSIGYSACHWCHVMERESFENEEVAAYMNTHFINIKIDREERPDLDHIYMDAVQAMTGSGGWPLNAFLTPDKKPFYGGTYFPPQNLYNRPSWMEVLAGVVNAFSEKRSEIESQAENLTAHMLNSNNFGAGAGSVKAGEEQLKLMKDNLLQQADKTKGGFGRAPKFPQTFSIQYLLRYTHIYNDADALTHALLSLDSMCRGGIYDQIGGGFARYSVDNEWLAPHFEKMLYDNALLISVLAEATQLTGNTYYKKIIQQTIAFLDREMLSPEGGYYAALDADSEGVEGKFYVWSYDEFMAAAGEHCVLAAAYFGVIPDGNWEHTNILHVPVAPEQFAAAHGITPDELAAIIAGVSEKLMAKRNTRVRPGLDDKLLLGWNGMMLTALSKAAAALGDDNYIARAKELARFLQQIFSDKETGAGLHSYKEGRARFPAFLDDYATWIQGLIHLQEVTGEENLLLEAERLTEIVLRDFPDENDLFFYYTAAGQEDIIVRKKEVYDGAVPSGNALMCWNLSQLGILLGRSEWSERADAMLKAFGSTVSRYPGSFGVWANLLLGQVNGLKEIVLKGAGQEILRKNLLKLYLPIRVLQSGSGKGEKFPLLEGKPDDGYARIYLCENYACQKPVSTIDELVQLLSNQ